jgi:hypothetical protein
LAIGQGLLVAGVCLVFGTWAARIVGLLESDVPAGETLGVGLATGLLVVASWWAAVASGGRSSFTPVAVGFTIAIGLVMVKRARAGAQTQHDARAPSPEGPRSSLTSRKDRIVAVVGGAVFMAAIALLFGSTMAPSPRDGVQPIEFNDQAYYSVLGADLTMTGSETIYSPSGFSQIDGLPTQTWYHWGELWLASAVITIFGMQPMEARHFVILPILLLAAAALSGTLVRRMTGAASRGAFLFGLFACLFLAPVALIPGPFFSSFARGLVYGITTYGLGAVAVLLAMYCIVVLTRREATWPLACFVGSAAAAILPAHIVIALLALVGVGSVWTIHVAQSLVRTRRLPMVAPVWRHILVATGVTLAATVAWGLLTGHGIGGSGLASSVSPFNASWRDSVIITAVCSGAILAIPIAWFMVRKDAPVEAALYVGTIAILIVGATAWGARIGDLNTVHLFFGGIAVFATPVAAVAAWSIWLRLRTAGHLRIAVAGLVLCITQMEFGVVLGVIRLQDFGRSSYAPIPLEILASVRDLPSGAKLAYACGPFEEVAFWESRLIAIDAHAGRAIVPMCFQAETAGRLIDTPVSAEIPSPLFEWAPQRRVYPDSGARPSLATVASFLKTNGVDYLYVDSAHPNALIPGAIPVATSGQTQVLRIP